MNNMFKEKLAELSGGRILDVATEGGLFIDRFKDTLEEYDDIIGIDITDENLRWTLSALSRMRSLGFSGPPGMLS